MSAPPAPSVLSLGRGGSLVQTSIGAVQFGAPPETIKDALGAGLEVPAIFVLPATWFARRRGITVAELEFPVYYNYFILGRRVTAVCDAEGRQRLQSILRESLFGPASYDLHLDYDTSFPVEARADLLRETSWFRKNARPATAAHPPVRGGAADPLFDLDDVLDFVLYDERGRAELGQGVVVERIQRPDGRPVWRLYEQGQRVAEIESEELGEPERKDPHPLSHQAFAPPNFGLTVLGSSHGFDPAGKTTGFLLWVNRRGVLVDPPTDSTGTLSAAGVQPQAVDTVILTHCHADHDAGVFQKILEAGRVNLYTTPTILGSFLRKYVALTGETEEHLRRLFVYRPVTIGAPLHIHGGEFRFFYTLHSIPTIGFECYFGGKSFVYSSDTLYDPGRIAALEKEGVLAPARAAALLNFPWHHSLVLHEAGVPPIHTPALNLAELPPDVKLRLRLIHIAEAALPEGRDLRLARTGFAETITLPVSEPPYIEALEALEALAAIDLFRSFTVDRCREFLTIVKRETHRAGALVIGQGEAGDRFYIIVAGEAAVVKDGVVVKSYHDGDFFGETALVTGAPRSADVRAKTDLVVMAVDKHDFLSFVRGTDLPTALVRLARNRDLPSWDLMSLNAVLRMLRTNQRTHLQAVLEHSRLAAGRVLWARGQVADEAWILDDAVVELHEEPHQVVAVLTRGAFVGDSEAILRKRPLTTEAVVTRAGGAFRIGAQHLTEFLEQTPAVMLALSGAPFAV